jgi:hypothetical protein
MCTSLIEPTFHPKSQCTNREAPGTPIHGVELDKSLLRCNIMFVCAPRSMRMRSAFSGVAGRQTWMATGFVCMQPDVTVSNGCRATFTAMSENVAEGREGGRGRGSWGEEPTVQPGGLASRIETDYDKTVLPTIQETLRLCVRRVLGRRVTGIFSSRGLITPQKTKIQQTIGQS